METSINKRLHFTLSAKTKSIVLDVITNLFILLFVYTAVSKIITFHTFEVVLSRSVLIGHFSKIVAWFIPAIEIIISLLLMFPKTKWLGLIGSFVLMIVFTSYLIYMINSGSTLTCNCGGIIASLKWKQHIFLNIALIIIAGGGIWLKNNLRNNNH